MERIVIFEKINMKTTIEEMHDKFDLSNEKNFRTEHTKGKNHIANKNEHNITGVLTRTVGKSFSVHPSQ